MDDIVQEKADIGKENGWFFVGWVERRCPKDVAIPNIKAGIGRE